MHAVHTSNYNVKKQYLLIIIYPVDTIMLYLDKIHMPLKIYIFSFIFNPIVMNYIKDVSSCLYLIFVRIIPYINYLYNAFVCLFNSNTLSSYDIL